MSAWLFGAVTQKALENERMMNVAVIGTGYVGLVAGTCFAELGHKVTCVDNSPEKLKKLQAGELPIYEPGLEEMVPKNMERGRLAFTNDLAGAVRAAEVVFIAVGTPPGANGAADLRYVFQVAEGIADALNGEFKVVVVKSTVPIGTGDRVRALIASRTQSEFAVVSNPEFLREGVAVPDFMSPDRILVGASDERAVEVMQRLYRPLTKEGAMFVLMDVRSSELTKYASNAMLATRISFMNEIATLCERVGADVEQVSRGMGADSRIGPAFLKAGLGYGGSCFPKDVSALIETAREYTVSLGILSSTVAANAIQKQRIVAWADEDFPNGLRGKRVALWGLAFKPQTDDMREAPSVETVRGLLAAGADAVVAYDPAAHETARAVLGDTIHYAGSAYEALEGADILCLVTEWAEFTAPDWERIKALMRGRTIYDGRNLWEPREVQGRGFTYRGVGRG